MPRIRRADPRRRSELLVKDAAKLLPDPSRRMFLRGGLSVGALTMLTGCDRQSTGCRPRACCAASRRSTTACRPGCSIPTGWRRPIPRARSTRPFRFNAYYPESDIPEVDGADYELEVNGLIENKETWTPGAAQRAAAGDADHAADLRRRLEHGRQMDRRAALRFPAPRRRRPDRQICLVPLRRGLSLVNRHGDRAASADPDDVAVRRQGARAEIRLSRCASASRPSSASRTPST